MSFLTPVGNAPRKSAPQNSKPSSSSSLFTSPEKAKTDFRSGSSMKFPVTVWTLYGDAVKTKILGNFEDEVALMIKQQFVDTVVSQAAKVCPAFSKSPFIKHTIIAIVKTEPVITEKFTLEFQVDEVIFVPEQKKLEWESQRSYTVRCNGNLAQFFHKNLAALDVLMITGGTLFCPGTNKWTEMILDLTDEKVNGPVSIVRLTNTKQKNNMGTEEPKRTAFGNRHEMSNQLKIYGKQWNDQNNNEATETAK